MCQSSKQHTLHIKCSFDQWLLATNSKENMLQWAASLHAAQPSKQTNKQVADLILAQGWLDLPKEDKDDEVCVHDGLVNFDWRRNPRAHEGAPRSGC